MMKRALMLAMLGLLTLSTLAFAATGQTAKAGKFTVTLATQPSPPAIGDTQFTITVKDGQKPITGAGVALHLDMVGMSMPSDMTAAAAKASGEYTAKANLSMEGQWTIAVKVQEMAGMAMDGDGTANFTLTVPKATAPASAAAPAATPTMPTHPAPISPLVLQIIIAFVVVDAIVMVIVVRKRMKKTQGQ